MPAPETTVPATVPALETTVPATDPAALADEVAVPTRLVTAALRRYQITRRLAALERRGLLRGDDWVTEGISPVSGSFGGNGINDALEQIAGAASCENQLGVCRIVFQFGAKPGDMNIHHAGVHMAFRCVSSHFLQDFPPAEWFA